MSTKRFVIHMKPAEQPSFEDLSSLPTVTDRDIAYLRVMEELREKALVERNNSLFQEVLGNMARWMDRHRKVISGQNIVETWWDCHSQNWFTDELDLMGYPVNTEAAGNKSSASVQHCWSVVRTFQQAKIK